MNLFQKYNKGNLKIYILHYSSELKLFYLSQGNIIYNDIDDKFIIINWSNIKSILITIKNNKAKFYLSKLSEPEAKSKIIKVFQNLQFTILDNLNISRPLDSNYSILCIELYDKGTEIEFEVIYNDKKDEKDKEDKEDKDDGLSAITIILIFVFAFLVIIIVFFFFKRYRKEKNIANFEVIAKILKNERLISDI